MTAAARRALAELLVSLFDDRELLHFLQFTFDERLTTALPLRVSLDELAAAVVDVLERRGLVESERLWSGLRAERPELEARILGVYSLVRHPSAPERRDLPFRRNSAFFGRDDEIEEVHHGLTRGDNLVTIVPAPHLFSGMRLGKTQLALEYAYRYRHCYREVRWIDLGGASPGSIRLSPQVANPRHPSDDAEPTAGPTLLVLDDVDDVAEALEALPPLEDTFVLITSRTRPDRTVLVELDVLPADSTHTEAEIEATYVRRFHTALMELQESRAFTTRRPLDLGGQVTSKSGVIEPGIETVRIGLKATTMSSEDRVRRFGAFGSMDYNSVLASDFVQRGEHVPSLADYLCNVEPGNIIQILGAPGSGKSYLLRDVALAWAAEHSTRRLVPLYVELRHAAASSLAEADHVMSFLAQTMADLVGMEVAQCYHLLQRAVGDERAAMVFDAIDEMGNPYPTLQAIRGCIRLSGVYRNRFLFSCRTFDQVPGFNSTELVILPPSREALREWFTQTISDDDLRQTVVRKLWNDSFARMLGTPLVASTVLRYVLDRGQVPASSSEALSFAIEQRFRQRVPDSAIGTDGIDEALESTFALLRVVASDLATGLTFREEEVLHVDLFLSDPMTRNERIEAVEWALRSGIIYRFTASHLCFALHRYKEYFLVQNWLFWHRLYGEWPAEIDDYYGRILYADLFVFLAEMLPDPVDIIEPLTEFCVDSLRNLPPTVEESDVHTRSRLVEAVSALGQIAASHRDLEGGTEWYHVSLYLLHVAMFMALTPGNKRRLIASLKGHQSLTACDVLLALAEDFTGDSGEQRWLRDAILTGLAHVAAAGAIAPGSDREKAWIERCGAHAADESMRRILNTTTTGDLLLTRTRRQWRLVHYRRRARAHLRNALHGFAAVAVVTVAYLTLGLMAALFAVLVPPACLSMCRYIVRRRQIVAAAHTEADAPQVVVDPEPHQYSATRYWIPVEHRHGARRRAKSSAYATGALVSLAFAFIFARHEVSAPDTPLFKALMTILGALFMGGMAIYMGANVFGLVHEVYKGYQWHRRRARCVEEWNSRLQRHSQEASRLQGDRENALYIAKNLFALLARTQAEESTVLKTGPAADAVEQVGIVHARLNWISETTSDFSEIRLLLIGYAKVAAHPDVQQLLWDAIDNIERAEALHAEIERDRPVDSNPRPPQPESTEKAPDESNVSKILVPKVPGWHAWRQPILLLGIVAAMLFVFGFEHLVEWRNRKDCDGGDASACTAVGRAVDDDDDDALLAAMGFFSRACEGGDDVGCTKYAEAAIATGDLAEAKELLGPLLESAASPHERLVLLVLRVWSGEPLSALAEELKWAYDAVPDGEELSWSWRRMRWSAQEHPEWTDLELIIDILDEPRSSKGRSALGEILAAHDAASEPGRTAPTR